MTNVNAQVFFASRATARSASFGKMTDNGSTAKRRWARSVDVSSSEKSVETLVCCHDRRNMNNAKSVTVVVKKLKVMVV